VNAFEFILILPEGLPSLLAILGLLYCWKLQEIEVQVGRIQPENVRDVFRHLARARRILLRRSAARLLPIYLSRNDTRTFPSRHIDLRLEYSRALWP
jgi:hypothetical protein